MKADVLAAANHFQSVKFGNPLLTTEEDNAYVVKQLQMASVIQDKKTASAGGSWNRALCNISLCRS
ncbi:MAG: hypothetical protein ACLTZM_20080 [Ruminococcus sp.]